MRACLFVVSGFVAIGSVTPQAVGGEIEGQALKLLLKGGAKLAAKKFANQDEGELAPPRPPRVELKEFVVRTPDDWSLVVRHYWVNGARLAGKPPVILCHGFGYSSEFFDLAPEVSLAQYLARAGFDVWAPDLRGCGKSSKWALGKPGGGTAVIGRLADKITKTEIPRYGFVSIDPKYYQWTLDDHVDRDIPAILGLVKQQTGAKRVSWIGHSMGGNVMLAYLAKVDDPSIERLATVGSQVTASNARIMVEYLGELLKLRTRQVAGEKLSFEEVLGGMNRLFFNEWNTAPEIMSALIHEAYDTPSVGLVSQYMDLCRTGRLQDSKRRFDYSAGVSGIRCPCLIMGGGVDQIAPPEIQRELYQRIGTQQKTLLILNRRSGLSVDYGHNDSLVGLRAREEVYPLIARWLAGALVGVNKAR